jgi:hypothetical protein
MAGLDLGEDGSPHAYGDRGRKLGSSHRSWLMTLLGNVTGSTFLEMCR